MRVRHRGRDLLDDVSLDANPGTVTALVGRNGAGKSVLLDVLARGRRPTAGTVRWFGKRLRRNEVAHVSQRRTAVGEIPRAPLVLLDDPFAGLGDDAVDSVTAQIRDRAREGCCVVLAGHRLGAVRAVADDVLVLVDGYVASRFPVPVREEGADLVEIVFTDPGTDTGWMRRAPGVRVVDLEPGVAICAVASAVALERLVGEASDRGAVQTISRGSVRRQVPVNVLRR